MLADAFNSRDNALNALRLFFALLVIVGHAGRLGFGVDGFGRPGLKPLGFAPSEVAVDGFFIISGYLICRSRVHGGPGGGASYLWKRFLRIVPGYGVCLLVTALVVSPIAWSFEYGSLHGFLTSRTCHVCRREHHVYPASVAYRRACLLARTCLVR